MDGLCHWDTLGKNKVGKPIPPLQGSSLIQDPAPGLLLQADSSPSEPRPNPQGYLSHKAEVLLFVL